MLRGHIREAITWAVGRALSRFGAAVTYSLAFKVLTLAMLAPLTAAGLRLFLQRWGRVSVGNFEIAAFLLSPVGLTALVVLGTVLLAALYLEFAGLLHLLADRRLAWWQALAGSASKLPQLVLLGLRQLVVFLLLAAPFLVGIGVVYWLFWSGRDLNGLIVLKPPAFWIGVALAGTLAAVYAVLAAWLFLRWLFAVPILLFEQGVSITRALRLSAERTRGRLGTLVGGTAVWAALQALVVVAVQGLMWLGSGWLLHQAGRAVAMVVPATAGLIVLHVVVGAGVGILGAVTFSGLVLALYRQAGGPDLVAEGQPAATTGRGGLSQPWVLVGMGVVLAVLTTLVSYKLLATVGLEDRLEITAHRAGAANAPENTVAAIRRAIADGADWAEIDVQLTADDALVVMHDTDLARIGAGNRQVGAVTLAEVRALDVGSLFGPAFAGEKVPTLEEVLAAAGDQIRLTIELKPHGQEDAAALTRRVVEAVRAAALIDRCRLCSQSYESMQLARQLEPNLRVGYIAAVALGYLAQLDVDFLMVKADRVNRALVERAGVRNIAIHAWTVNDPDELLSLLDAGVTNVITDDPGLLRARLQEIRGLNPVERLLLRVRDVLAG